MRYVDFRVVLGRLWVIAAATLMVIAFSGDIASAQQSPAPDATQKKIDQLTKLLEDPDIRALLASRSTAPPDTEMTNMSASDLTSRLNAVQEHLFAVRQAIPLIPSEFARAVETTKAGVDGRRPIGVFLFFCLLVAIGLAAEWFFGRILRRLFARRPAAQQDGAPVNGFHLLGHHLFVQIAPLVVFGLASVGLFLSFSWPPLLSRLIVPTLLGLIAGRVIIRLSKVLLAPYADATGLQPFRLVPIDDHAARFWFTRVIVFTFIYVAGWAADGIMGALGFLPPVQAALDYLFGIVLLLAAIEIVWNRPRPAERPHRGVLHWLLIFWFCVLWVLWVTGLAITLLLGIYLVLVPATLKLTTSIIRNAFGRGDPGSPSGRTIYEVLVERGVRAAVIAVAVSWVVLVMRLHPIPMMQEDTVARVIRGVLGGVVILLVADVLWQMVKAFINHRLEVASHVEGDAATMARSGRLLTLLPIFRNFLAVLIGAIAIMMALSGLGVEVGPLIAGAGIFGVAIGFGSQTLVKDVISGIFYMMDDAFRVGEYIQSGSYKGTVESFSIRSVKLRHHRGPIFTVPFGVLGAVQNMSRDWVIDKFLISVGYQTDIVLVKKLVKGVGATLLEDPELGPMIIETVKMKGVEQFGDYGINLSFAFMTKPGHQSGVRRRAYAMIREAFVANGIVFASPTVQVANEEHAAVVAAATTNNIIAMKKAAAESAEGAGGA
ncbi:mechanosensitive ion channel family protein [Rhizobium sp. 2YAF20]|uniref:mechanosensitive ion channel family protein n=1 Tax=Rhizobium sp. 2YAF20 TaxID=3233027 RepID=UPI003F9CB9C7